MLKLLYAIFLAFFFFFFLHPVHLIQPGQRTPQGGGPVMPRTILLFANMSGDHSSALQQLQ